MGMPLQGARVAIQGFGNVGYWAAHFFAAAGAQIVAVSDVEGTLLAPDGMDPDAVNAVSEARGSVVHYDAPGVERLDRDALIGIDCDVLVPAALGGAINVDNAHLVRARLVAEGANHPTTPGGDEILQQAVIRIIPDIYANAGGVTVSYFQWVQNRQHMRWEAQRVDAELRKVMTRAYAAIKDAAEEFRVDLRTAAFIVAVRRVSRAGRLRGMR